MIHSNKIFTNCLFCEQQVVGWGLDKFGISGEKLNMLTMPVVSHDICIRSDIKFFPVYAHETTFCAGLSNGIFMFRQ